MRTPDIFFFIAGIFCVSFFIGMGVFSLIVDDVDDSYQPIIGDVTGTSIIGVFFVMMFGLILLLLSFLFGSPPNEKDDNEKDGDVI